MTIAPTLSGGLRLIPEEEQDWSVLLEIADDGEGNLEARFGNLMDEDSMWEEIVVPELKVDFSAQRKEVRKAVLEAREQGREGVTIEREQADLWYGALNQARLLLEERFRFGPSEFVEVEKIKDAVMRSAYFRNEFYSQVQSLLLEYVMGDG